MKKEQHFLVYSVIFMFCFGILIMTTVVSVKRVNPFALFSALGAVLCLVLLVRLVRMDDGLMSGGEEKGEKSDEILFGEDVESAPLLVV